MASSYITIKKYTGVCYKESKKQWRDKPDRIYWVRFKDDGKVRYEKCGRASEGWTPESAQQKRYKLLEEKRVGKYKPKLQRDKEAIVLSVLVEEHYLPWSQVSKKNPKDDPSRYNSWIKKELGDKKLNEISIKDIENLMSKMRNAGRAEATIRQVVALLRHIFNKAIEWNLWEGSNPCSSVKLPKLNNSREKFLSKDEANLLLTTIRKYSVQIAQIATLSLYTGMRRGEIFSLKWQDVDSQHGIISILDSKNNQSRKVFITEPVREILDELQPGKKSDFLFTNAKGEKIQFLSKTFAKAVKETGLNRGVSDRRLMVSFHPQSGNLQR